MSKGKRTKLPAKAAAAGKAIESTAPTVEAGFVVTYHGERIKLRQKDYEGSFKKLLKAAIEMQQTDPHFEWRFYDTLPE